MAHMSPDMYRGVLEKAKGLVDEIKAYLNGRTTDGSTIPIVFKNALEEMILECESTEANLSMAIKGLKPNSPQKPKYQNTLEKIDSVQRELKNYKDELFK